MKYILIIFSFLTTIFAQTNIVVSIAPQQTFVEKIGGDKVSVSTMVRAGSDPHSYEPKPSQMIDISKANIYFPIGLEFENTWLDKFANQNKDMQFVEMTKDIEKITMKSHHHHDERHDNHKEHHEHKAHSEHEKLPYEWAGVFELKKGVYNWSFSKVDGNYADLAMKILILKADKESDDLIEDYEETAEHIFEKNKTIIPTNSKFMVFHPSWGYFAKEYNLVQFEIEVEGKEPKPKMLQKIINEAKEENIKAIFTQTEFSDKSAKVIANELKIKVIKETPLAKDWAENLIKMANAIANNN